MLYWKGMWCLEDDLYRPENVATIIETISAILNLKGFDGNGIKIWYAVNKDKHFEKTFVDFPNLLWYVCVAER